MDEDLRMQIINAHRCFDRGGNIMKNIFSNPEKIVSSQDALLLFNTYGLPIKYLTIIIRSHGFTFDETEFIKLLEQQKQRMKNSVLCSNER